MSILIFWMKLEIKHRILLICLRPHVYFIVIMLLDSVQTGKKNIDIHKILNWLPRFDEKISLSIHISQEYHCCRQQPFLLVNKFLFNQGRKPSLEPSCPNVQTQTFNTDCVLETQATTIGNTAPWRTVSPWYAFKALWHITDLGGKCYKSIIFLCAIYLNIYGVPKDWGLRAQRKHLSTPQCPQSMAWLC